VGAILSVLRATDADLDRMDEAVASRLGISRTDIRCLDILSRGTEMTPSQLAAEIGLSTGATTALVDRLERAGFVSRERDSRDRRRIFLRVTNRAMKQVWPTFQGLVVGSTRLLHQFRRDELEIILRFLEKHRDVVRENLPPLAEAKSPERKSGSRRRG